MMRPPREDYVRCSVQSDGFCLEPAVEWREGDHFATLMYQVRNNATKAVADAALDVGRELTPMEAADAIAKRFVAAWPDRAYFVEVWQEGREGFAQVFQPFGVPRNR